METNDDGATTNADARPDHEVAREELAAMVARFGLEMSGVEHVPVREMTREEVRASARTRARGQYWHLPFACDPTAGRVRFKLTSGRCARASHVGTYSAGSGIVERWGLDPANRAAVRKVLGLPFLLHRDALDPRTVDGRNALMRAAQAWRPELVDVVASMLSDVAGWGPGGMTFREWLSEGLAEGQDAADALDTFNAIEAEYRFLARVFGTELGAACELAGRL